MEGVEEVGGECSAVPVGSASCLLSVPVVRSHKKSPHSDEEDEDEDEDDEEDSGDEEEEDGEEDGEEEEEAAVKLKRGGAGRRGGDQGRSRSIAEENEPANME